MVSLSAHSRHQAKRGLTVIMWRELRCRASIN
ncbi:Uncharacterised protein [Vibrio cholerae]|nr:Uncharacterised protein [Vibrio cholerae]